MTLEEYDRAASSAQSRIVGYLGLRFQDRIEGDWNIVTISGRGSATVLRFPEGTFAPTSAEYRVRTRGPAAPGIVAAARDSVERAQARHRVVVRLGRDERADVLFSVEQNRRNFFRSGADQTYRAPGFFGD